MEYKMEKEENKDMNGRMVNVKVKKIMILRF